MTYTIIRGLHSITLSGPISWWLEPFGQIWFSKIIRVQWQRQRPCRVVAKYTGVHRVSVYTQLLPFFAFDTLSMSLVRLIALFTEESLQSDHILRPT